jgi:hypothetical protein
LISSFAIRAVLHSQNSRVDTPVAVGIIWH